MWGALTGEWGAALGVCLFFELLWLDLFPAGTYIPPHGALAVFISLSVSHLLAFSASSQVFPVMVLSLPMAWLGSRLEQWQRGFQNKSYNQLIQWSRDDWETFRPQLLVKGSILQIALMNLVLFTGATIVLVTVLTRFSQVGRLMPATLTWPMLWLLASIGGVLSLRIRRAYALLGVGMCCVGLLFFLMHAGSV